MQMDAKDYGLVGVVTLFVVRQSFELVTKMMGKNGNGNGKSKSGEMPVDYWVQRFDRLEEMQDRQLQILDNQTNILTRLEDRTRGMAAHG